MFAFEQEYTRHDGEHSSTVSVTDGTENGTTSIAEEHDVIETVHSISQLIDATAATHDDITIECDTQGAVSTTTAGATDI